MSLRYVSLSGLLAFALLGQDPYGRITGRVVDSTGAIVAGASIRAKNIESNLVTNASSDSQGNYEARNLIPGEYELVIEMKGFKRYQRGPIEVRLGDVLTVDIAMELGAVSENVTVTGEAPLLESASASVGQVVDRKRLLDLPIPSSNPTYLIQVVPGIMTNTAPSGNWQVNQTGASSAFSTNGTAIDTTEFSIDGVPAMSTGDLISILPMPEVLQEFRVQTAPFDASVGHFMGAQVSMVTKSGSNAVHGSATYQFNGRALNSVPFFPDTILHTGPISHEKIEENFPASRANRYRGTVSGPAYIPKLYDGRNRTFFTVGVDYFMRVFVPNIDTNTVPTAPERNGDFSALLKLGSQYQIYDPATIAPAAGGRFSRQPLPNNIIPASRIDPIAQGVLNYYPLPNTPGTVDGLNNYIGSPVNRPTHHNYFGRFDEVITSNQRLFVSYQHTLEHTPQQTSGFPSDFLGITNYNPGFIVTVDDVISLRPNLVL